ncbi:MAG: hypothetical protein MZV70_66935 [Desulfobacterales bacterium]|nr:hypothetical protein [Desulfobacterales bacterium]
MKRRRRSRCRSGWTAANEARVASANVVGEPDGPRASRQRSSFVGGHLDSWDLRLGRPRRRRAGRAARPGGRGACIKDLGASATPDGPGGAVHGRGVRRDGRPGLGAVDSVCSRLFNLSNT